MNGEALPGLLAAVEDAKKGSALLADERFLDAAAQFSLADEDGFTQVMAVAGERRLGKKSLEGAIARRRIKFHKPPDDAPTNPHEDEADPHRLARLYLADHTRDGLPTLRCWNEEYLSWDGRAYRTLPDHDVQAGLCARIKGEFDSLNIEAIARWERRGRCDERGNRCPRPAALSVNNRLVADVLGALNSLTLLPAATTPPTWLCTTPPFPASEVLACGNGLVHLPSISKGQEHYFRSPSPLFFSRNCLDFAFDEYAPSPTKWLSFLHDLWKGDEDSINTLQDWFGYCLTPDTSQQKILMIVGPTRSGKGTIARVMTAVLGSANVCNPTLGSLGSNFGLQPLLGKNLAIISDARMSGRMDSVTVAENLLAVSGEDSRSVPRKFKTNVEGRLPIRFMLMTNELPRLADASDALPNRFIILSLVESWLGREDPGLTAALLTELPGILSWAVAGWHRLFQRGFFVQPDASADLVQEMHDLSSPVRAFVQDCCLIGPAYEVSVDALFERWNQWCDTNGKKERGTVQTFGRDLRAALPQLQRTQPREDGHRVRYYAGIAINNQPFL